MPIMDCGFRTDGEAKMLYEYVKGKWQSGLVSIGLPALGYGNPLIFEGSGMAALAIRFLRFR